jgi:hypothetical protein
VSKRKAKNSFWNIFLLVVFVVAGVALIASLVKVPNSQVIKTSFIVSDKVGFDLNKNELTFGSIQPGGTASRALTIQNNFNQDIIITLNSEGNIRDYLIASENDFTLRPNEKKNVTFTVFSYKNQSYGNYTGKINIIFKYV